MLNAEQIVWCHGARPEYALDEVPHGDELYIPARAIPAVRPGQDLILLPGARREVREFARFACATLGLSADQFFWTSGRHFVLDDDVLELLPELGAWLGEPGRWLAVPYSVTESLTHWTTKLGIPVYADTEVFSRQFGHKGILHPAQDGYGESLPRDLGIPVARGYLCRGVAELLSACHILRDSIPRRGVILKPTLGSAGEGIVHEPAADLLENYDFRLGPVVLEELLPVDSWPDGSEISVSVQTLGDQLMSGVTDQLVARDEWIGNRVPSRTPRSFQAQVIRATQQVLGWLHVRGLRGPGGFDFLSVAGEPVLVDVNIGRFTGAHIPKIFRERYAPGMEFIAWKFRPSDAIGVFDLWQRLRSAGLAFLPGQSTNGVFPLCWLPGIWGMFIAIGRSQEEILGLRRATSEIGFQGAT